MTSQTQTVYKWVKKYFGSRTIHKIEYIRSISIIDSVYYLNKQSSDFISQIMGQSAD